MLQENDDQLAALGGKVSALRALSYDIEGEVRSQNELLEDMDGSVGGAGDLLRRTMGKLDAMIGAGGNRHMWYLVAFVMAVMFCLWWLAKR
jgi:blocked-early-in-transport protein 1